VAIPDAPDGCAAFQIEYDATLPSDGCPEVGCRCSYQGPTPTPKNGCVVAVDCSAACAAPDGDAWLVCAIEGCAADANCEQPGVCEAQVCKSGGAGACGSKHCTGSDVCVAVAADGTRRCVTPSDRSACNADADCVEGHCALPDGSFLGLCTTGQNQDACFADTDCQPRVTCIDSICTDGTYGSFCATQADCLAGYCAGTTCNDGRDHDYCETATQCQSRICIAGIRCGSGEVGADCRDDEDCHSRLCAANSLLAACTDGAPSSQCLEDSDCLSGACSHPLDKNPAAFFGACD